MRTSTSFMTIAVAAQLLVAGPAGATGLTGVTPQPNPNGELAKYYIDPASEPQLSSEQLTELLRKKIKYVFVIFNENRSFDNEFGTFPGANGIYSDGYQNGVDKVRAPEATPGFTQQVTDEPDGVSFTLQPFRVGLKQGATAVDSVDHSHGNFVTINGKPTLWSGLAYKIDVGSDGVAKMDHFAQDEYNRHSKPAAANAPKAIAQSVQYSRLVMSYTDCETTPFAWNWASHFVLFDNIYATEDTPSTPNAIAMIAGQAGETQWVKHGPNGNDTDKPTAYPAGTISEGVFKGVPYKAGSTLGVPVYNDPQPFYSSQFDATTGEARAPSSPSDSRPDADVVINQTYATVPLTLMGKSVNDVLSGNLSPNKSDLADIQKDMAYIAGLNHMPVNWRWYQEGYGLESTDAPGIAAPASGKLYTGNGTPSHAGYVLHHNGPAYFGYLANTPAAAGNMRSLTDFFTDTAKNTLPDGGVFYIRGGFQNQLGMRTFVGSNPDLTKDEVDKVALAKNGDDDHPGYTDHQITESTMAKIVNAVAQNPTLWSQSAIVITYDESDGYYDHVSPRILSYGPDGLPIARGVRIPLTLISPYARTHVVAHAEGDHNSVIETINAIFNTPALSSLPDEAEALKQGNSPEFNRFGPAGFEQKYLGPRDTPSPITDSLLSGFSPKRLAGDAEPLPASFAVTPESVVDSLPHYGTNACKVIGITPENQLQSIATVIPEATTVGAQVPVAKFNGLPGTLPDRN
ncbi:MAG: alkaline phosphatase family protein [Ancalomicrobiaceae bacterium]|nr:alkaline phosphatase family protein [Ancalomicrobiaceae bacterium]